MRSNNTTLSPSSKYFALRLKYFCFPSAPACPSPTTALLARTRPAPRPASPSSTTSTRTGSSGTTWPATTRSPPSASPGTRQQTLLLFIHIYTIYIQPVTVQKSQNISLLYTIDLLQLGQAKVWGVHAGLTQLYIILTINILLRRIHFTRKKIDQAFRSAEEIYRKYIYHTCQYDR